MLLNSVIIGGVFFIVVHQLRHISWSQVLENLTKYSWDVVFFTLILVLIDYLLLSFYDYLSLKSLLYRPKINHIFPISFVAYALNFSLGSLIGGMAFRYRVYRLLGLSRRSITWLIVFVMSINWLGFFIVTGINFLFFSSYLVELWLDQHSLRLLGAFMLMILLLLIVAYYYRQKIKGFVPISFPQIKQIYLWLQLLTACIHWLLVSAIIYFLFLPVLDVKYSEIVTLYHGSSVLAAVSHIPGGIGVIETVFVMAFSNKINAAFIFSSILVFRFLYFWLPLMIAVPSYLGIERLASRSHIFHELGK